MTPSPQPDGLPLAIDERTGATIWPREHFPAADDALAAHAVEMDGEWDIDLGADMEPYELRRVRLVWAGPHPDPPEPGWWEWVYAPRPGLVECWEISPR